MAGPESLTSEEEPSVQTSSRREKEKRKKRSLVSIPNGFRRVITTNEPFVSLDETHGDSQVCASSGRSAPVLHNGRRNDSRTLHRGILSAYRNKDL